MLCCAVLCCVALYVLCCVALYCVVCVALYCVVLCCAVLCCVVLCCAMMYYSVLSTHPSQVLLARSSKVNNHVARVSHYGGEDQDATQIRHDDKHQGGECTWSNTAAHCSEAHTRSIEAINILKLHLSKQNGFSVSRGFVA